MILPAVKYATVRIVAPIVRDDFARIVRDDFARIVRDDFARIVRDDFARIVRDDFARIVCDENTILNFTNYNINMYGNRQQKVNKIGSTKFGVIFKVSRESLTLVIFEYTYSSLTRATSRYQFKIVIKKI